MTVKRYATGALAVNTYLVYDDTKKAFVVDPGGPDKRLVEDIKNDGLDLEYVILTHGHCDHIGGIQDIRDNFPGVKVIAHEAEKEMLADPGLNTSTMFFGTALSETADIWVKDNDTMKIGNMDLSFIHTPGHSMGGMCILMDNVCFSGDTLFRASVGRSDLQGGDWDTLMNSIKTRLYVLPDDTVVFPGHMGETTIGFEKRYNPFVQDRDN